jgi:aminomethyltransferase
MDMTRMEAGYIMNGVDYWSAHHCLIESRKSTPYELALDWMVDLDREPFVGQPALAREKAEGPRRVLAGLVVDWDEFAALFARHGLPPEVRRGAWRDPVPVYARGGGQVGYATSGSWSPLLKKNLALATVEPGSGHVGAALEIEVTVEYRRCRAAARVVPKPFFDPERKRA